MIFELDRDSLTHTLLPRRRVMFLPKCISRVSVAVALIASVLGMPQAGATGYPEPGTFAVIESETEIRVLVYRGGLLGGFGHNHTISTSDASGRIEIRKPPDASLVALTIPVESLEVDADRIRNEEGKPFAKAVPEKDRLGTRKNMLGPKLLDSANYGSIEIQSREWSGVLPDILVEAAITVKDHTGLLSIPAAVSASEERIVVTGRFAVTHGQLGLEPFKAGFGSLRVRDEMVVKFRITAERTSD